MRRQARAQAPSSRTFVGLTLTALASWRCLRCHGQVHSLIGDYHTGLQCLHPLNLFDKTHLYTPVLSSCHISLFYYASFAYLMLQRYTDAGR
jgi:hypothetical protein